MRALCDGVGVEVASVDTIKAFAPQAVTLRRRGDADHRAAPVALRSRELRRESNAQEREESAAFRGRGNQSRARRARSGGAFSKSYAALTAESSGSSRRDARTTRTTARPTSCNFCPTRGKKSVVRSSITEARRVASARDGRFGARRDVYVS